MGKGKDIAVGRMEEVMTEENLRKAWCGKILSLNENSGSNLRICVPVRCWKDNIWDSKANSLTIGLSSQQLEGKNRASQKL
ncbi:MAG: hypothetical protein ACUVTL_10225 [Thermoproteota archaeon]